MEYSGRNMVYYSTFNKGSTWESSTLYTLVYGKCLLLEMKDKVKNQIVTYRYNQQSYRSTNIELQICFNFEICTTNNKTVLKHCIHRHVLQESNSKCFFQVTVDLEDYIMIHLDFEFGIHLINPGDRVFFHVATPVTSTEFLQFPRADSNDEDLIQFPITVTYHDVTSTQKECNIKEDAISYEGMM